MKGVFDLNFSKLIITKKTFSLLLILALLTSLQANRWEKTGYEYYPRGFNQATFYSTEPVKLHDLISIYNIQNTEHDLDLFSVRYYYKDIITSREKSVFWGSVDYYGKGTSFGSRDGITQYSSPILTHVAGGLVYLIMGLIAIIILKNTKQYRLGTEPTFTAISLTVLISLGLSFLLNLISLPIITILVLTILVVAGVLLLLFQKVST